MLETCGDAENQLALELTQHESFVEKEIVDPLCNIAEVSSLTGPHRRARIGGGRMMNGLLVSTVLTVISGFDICFFLERRGINGGYKILCLRGEKK